MRTHVHFLAGAILVLTACSGSSSDSSSPSNGSGGSGGSVTGGGAGGCSPKGYDGETACGATVCSADEYCSKESTSILICRPGCLTSGNCASGMACDFAGSTTGVGVCRVGTCGAGGSGGGASCPTVDGAYKLNLDTAKSSSQCKQGFTGTNACSVMQSACTVNTTCSGAGFAAFTIDANGKGNTTTTVQGVTFNCAVTFSKVTGNFLEFNCSANVGGTPIVCTGSGS